MALQPSLTQVSIADDASVITVKDSTGAYNASTNAGGYGSPNPAQDSIAAIIFAAIYYSDVNTPYYYKPSDFSALFTDAGLGLLALNFAGISQGTAFNDGVYSFKYYVGFAGSNVSFSAGATQFAYTGADTAFATAVAFSIPSNDPAKLYFIDRVQSLTSTGGYVTTPLPDISTPVAINIFYEGDLKVLNDKSGNNCLIQDLGVWSENNCVGDDWRDVWKRYQMKVALEAKFSLQLFQDAHNLAVKLSGYCSSAGQNLCGC